MHFFYFEQLNRKVYFISVLFANDKFVIFMFGHMPIQVTYSVGVIITLVACMKLFNSVYLKMNPVDMLL